ncbi:hypothetical protein HU200_033263 [Digitaria exilis]|uniref:Plant heme peroxidase family profile domain-containing protein n=1 Tax=Digitaria exilis TaxID=1010633 RepID=A0A835BLX7_9POAL|nr:hypothetical protein HU200_033263 [Digitaria exilis]
MAGIKKGVPVPLPTVPCLSSLHCADALRCAHWPRRVPLAPARVSQPLQCRRSPGTRAAPSASTRAVPSPTQPPPLQHHLFDGREFRFLPTPPPPDDERTVCDACGEPAHGFVYHYSGGDKDLHPCCASLPRTITLHGGYAFKLCPSASRGCCALCGEKVRRKFWAYRWRNVNNGGPTSTRRRAGHGARLTIGVLAAAASFRQACRPWRPPFGMQNLAAGNARSGGTRDFGPVQAQHGTRFLGLGRHGPYVVPGLGCLLGPACWPSTARPRPARGLTARSARVIYKAPHLLPSQSQTLALSIFHFSPSRRTSSSPRLHLHLLSSSRLDDLDAWILAVAVLLPTLDGQIYAARILLPLSGNQIYAAGNSGRNPSHLGLGLWPGRRGASTTLTRGFLSSPPSSFSLTTTMTWVSLSCWEGSPADQSQTMSTAGREAGSGKKRSKAWLDFDEIFEYPNGKKAIVPPRHARSLPCRAAAQHGTKVPSGRVGLGRIGLGGPSRLAIAVAVTSRLAAHPPATSLPEKFLIWASFCRAVRLFPAPARAHGSPSLRPHLPVTSRLAVGEFLPRRPPLPRTTTPASPRAATRPSCWTTASKVHAQCGVFKLPPPTASMDYLLSALKNASLADLVALSGAHTIDKANCSAFGAVPAGGDDDMITKRVTETCSLLSGRQWRGVV